MTGSKNYNNPNFFLNNKRAQTTFIQDFGTQETKSIFSRLLDALTLVFEMYYIKFKIQEIKDSIHSFTENKKGRIFSMARNISAPATFKTNYATNPSTEIQA